MDSYTPTPLARDRRDERARGQRGVRMVAGMLAALSLATAAAPGCTTAEQREPYRATSHRSFENVEQWTKVFDAPDRASWQKPEAVVAALAIPKGTVIADVGAGTGYFSRFWSTAVGPSGTVFAVDVEPNLVSHLRKRAEAEQTANVVPVLASFDNPRLPADAVDLAVIVDTYHHIDHRHQYLDTLRRCLKPNGRIAIVDWKAGKLPVGPKEEDHKIAPEQVIREMTTAGYVLVEQPEILPYQYVLVFGAHSPAASD